MPQPGRGAGRMMDELGPYLKCCVCGAIVEHGDDCACGATWLGIVFNTPTSDTVPPPTWLICDKMRAAGLASSLVLSQIHKVDCRIGRLQRKLGLPSA